MSLRIEIGGRYSTETGAPASDSTALTPGATPNEVRSARAKLTLPVPWTQGAAHVYGEYEQDIFDADKRLAAVGGEYQLDTKTRLYARHELISSLGGPFELPSGSLVIASQTRDRFTGTATFVAPSLGLTRRFVFRLSGTVDTASATRGSYLVSVTGGLPGALTGDGGFEGRVTGGVDLRLDGQLRNPGDQCHMTVNVVGTPAAAAHASVPQGQLGDSTLGTLPRLFRR